MLSKTVRREASLPIFQTHHIELTLAHKTRFARSTGRGLDFQMICCPRGPHDRCLDRELAEYCLHEPRSVVICEVGELFLLFGEPGMTGFGSQLAGPVLKCPIADSAFEKLVNLSFGKIT